MKQGKQADHRYSEDAGTHEQRPSGKNSEGQSFETGKMSMVSDVVRDMMTTSVRLFLFYILRFLFCPSDLEASIFSFICHEKWGIEK